MADQYVLTEEFVREWNRVRSKVDKMKGRGVNNQPTYITISDPSAKSPRLSGGESDQIIPQYAGMFLGAVTANTLAATFIFAVDAIVTS